MGGYTADMGGTAEGIGLLRSRPDGSLENVGVAASTDSPSYVLVTDSTVFAAGEGSGRITAFARHPSASAGTTPAGTTLAGTTLAGTTLTETVSGDAGGGEPCHLSLYGDTLVDACYSEGNLTALDSSSLSTPSTLRAEGSGPLPQQAGPHAHSSAQLADGRILSADLGSDRLHVHSLDATAAAAPTLVRRGSVELPAGTGPRDIRVLSNGLVLVLAEFGLEILVLEVAADSSISIVARVPLPGAVPGDQAAAIAMSSDERFFYSGLRGSNSISVLEFVADAMDVPASAASATGSGSLLRPVGWVSAEGEWPRHLIVDGSVLHVCNQLSNSVASFALGDDGMPSLIAEPTPVGSPTVLARA